MSGRRGRSGRRPKPLAEHILKGSYRRHRHGPLPIGEVGDGSQEVRAGMDAGQAPRELTVGERTYWALHASRLTPSDAGTLADYCRASYRVAHGTDRLARAWRRPDVDPKFIRWLDASTRRWLGLKKRLAVALGIDGDHAQTS